MRFGLWFPATFVLHHPEHGHAVILPIISCIIDGLLEYDKNCPPFASFISLVCPSSEVSQLLNVLVVVDSVYSWPYPIYFATAFQYITYCLLRHTALLFCILKFTNFHRNMYCTVKLLEHTWCLWFLLLTLQNEYSEQWALACGEILRILTHYNRPVFKVENNGSEADRSNSGNQVSTSKIADGEQSSSSSQQERRPLRPLSPWITDILLAAPLGIRSDYFRW